MPNNITERHHNAACHGESLPTALANLSAEEYREAVRNIRTFFTLLDRWHSGLDAANRPGYDELRDNNDGGKDI